MNFMEAVKAMKEGKKVRRNYWKENRCLERRGSMDDSLIRTKDNDDFLDNTYINLSDFEATDWEIYEEKRKCNYYRNGKCTVIGGVIDCGNVKSCPEKKKTLSDKIIDSTYECRLRAVDVKQSLKEFIEKDIKLYVTKLSPISNKVDMDEWNEFVDKKAKEIFGSRLLK